MSRFQWIIRESSVFCASLRRNENRSSFRAAEASLAIVESVGQVQLQSTVGARFFKLDSDHEVTGTGAMSIHSVKVRLLSDPANDSVKLLLTVDFYFDK